MFKKNVDVEFFYVFLSERIKEKIFFYGISESITKEYLENSIITGLTSSRMHNQIRRCLTRGIDPRKFIESSLIPKVKDYILGYSENLIENNFNEQIQIASQRYAVSDIVKQFEELRNEAQALIKACFSDSLQQSNFLKQSARKWNSLIFSAWLKTSIIEAISVSSPQKIACMLILLFLVPFLYSHHLTLTLSLTHLGVSYLHEDPQEAKRSMDDMVERDSLVEKDSAMISTILVILFGIFTVIFFAAKGPRAFILYFRQPFEDVLLTAADNYRAIYQNLRQQQQDASRPNLFDVIPPRTQKTTSSATSVLSESLTSDGSRSGRPPKRRNLSERKIADEKDEPITSRHELKIFNHQGSYYLQLNNAHGCPTQRFFRRPPSPIDELTKKCFNQVKTNPVEHAATSKGKAGLKRLGPGEHTKFPGCINKIKLHDGTRVGVIARLAAEEEQQVMIDCKEVLEVNPKRIGKK